MKLREEEFYEQYHQHGGTTIIPTEIFNELYDDATEEIERLKEQLNDEIDDELKQSQIMVKQHNEIARLTAESTKWESKFYDEAKKVDKAIEHLERLNNIINEFDKWLIGEKMMFYRSSDNERLIRYGETKNKWLEIKGSDKE